MRGIITEIQVESQDVALYFCFFEMASEDFKFFKKFLNPPLISFKINLHLSLSL